MRAAKFLAGLLAALLVQMLGTRLWPAWPRAVDLFLVLAVLNAIDGRSLPGMLGGLVAGLARDAVAGGAYGLHGLADTIVGYLTARTGQRLVIHRVTRAVLVLAGAALLQQAILWALTAWLLETERPAWGWSGARILTTGVLGSALFLGRGTLERFGERRRRRRVEKLRL